MKKTVRVQFEVHCYLLPQLHWSTQRVYHAAGVFCLVPWELQIICMEEVCLGQSWERWEIIPLSSPLDGGRKGSFYVRLGLFGYLPIFKVLMHFQVTSPGSCALPGKTDFVPYAMVFLVGPEMVPGGRKSGHNTAEEEKGPAEIHTSSALRAERCEYAWKWCSQYYSNARYYVITFLWWHLLSLLQDSNIESSGSIFEEMHLHKYHITQ